MKINKARWTLFILVFVIIVFVVLTISGFSKTEYQKKPIIQEKIANKDTAYLYNFYVSSKPVITTRPYYGNKNATITIAAYISIESSASRYFMTNIFPELKKEYIDTGKVKFYHKNYVTVQDQTDNTSNYIYAKSLLCVNFIDSTKYYPFYFDLFDLTNTSGIITLLNKHNIDIEKYSNCMKIQQFRELTEDMSEIENFGLQGMTPRYYMGVGGEDNTVIDGTPTYTKFKDTIRQYQTLIGD